MNAPYSDLFAVSFIDGIAVIRLLRAEQYSDASIWTHDEFGRQLWNDLRSFLRATRPLKVVLDYDRLTNIGWLFVISHPITSAFLSAKKLSGEFGCQWRICGLHENLRKAYPRLTLSRIFPKINENPSEAVAEFLAENSD